MHNASSLPAGQQSHQRVLGWSLLLVVLFACFSLPAIAIKSAHSAGQPPVTYIVQGMPSIAAATVDWTYDGDADVVHRDNRCSATINLTSAALDKPIAVRETGQLAGGSPPGLALPSQPCQSRQPVAPETAGLSESELVAREAAADLGPQETRAVRSLEQQIAEHQQKLEAYKAAPMPSITRAS